MFVGAVLIGVLLGPPTPVSSAAGPASQQSPTAGAPAPATPDAPADPGQPPRNGEDQAEAKKPPTPPHTGIHALLSGYLEDIKHLPSTENLFIAVAGGGMAGAIHPFDRSFNAHLRSHYDLVNATYAPAKYLGDTPEQVALSLGTYAYGRLFDEPKVSHLGMDLLRAQMLSETLVEPLKFATRRERPNGVNRQSFPSGHSSATFAAATVLERHVGWKRAALAYVIATYVATSRLHDNVHYASDVVFGSAVGIIAGRTVTEHGRNNWTFAPVARPGGVEIVAMRVNR